MNAHDESCGCPPPPHPKPPEIPAGQTTLPGRQAAGFGEYREAMLAAIPASTALAGWRARGEADLGVMLLEAWAYVLDVTGFYDARVAERAYLATAPDTRSARRLTALIGHRPRPAMAARVTLAVDADGADPVTLPKGTAFRSQPFGKGKPQVFELAAETVIWPQRNRWQLAPVREDAFDGTLRFLPRRAPAAGAVVVLWTDTHAAAARISAIEPETGQDGAAYLRAVLAAESGLEGMKGQRLSAIQLAIARLPLARSAFATRTEMTSVVVLDALYSQLRPNERAVAEVDGRLAPVTITGLQPVAVTVDSETGARMTVTQVRFQPALEIPDGASFTLHAGLFALGSPTRPAMTEITLAALRASGALTPPVAPLGAAPAGGAAIAQGKRAEGVLVPGAVEEQGAGAARFQPDAAAASFAAPLAVPVVLYGNLVEAVRGESVTDEALGSADAAAPFNSFALKKAPLVWVEDASQPRGRRAELTVRVDQLEWAPADSFFGRGPEERIYVLRQDSDGGTSVVFGDGRRGARPPTGVGNVRADYRHGAGAAKPPVGLIDQIAVPVRRLAAVRNPVPATGGADPEAADELRQSAPAGALTLGRAVTLADFGALARGFPGVLNAAAGWAWDERRQRAGVKLWIIADGGDPTAALVSWLAGQAAADLGIVAVPAGRASVGPLSVSLGIAPGHDPARVRDAAWTALFDTRTGLLAARNAAIGRALFRSVLTHRLHQVAGIAAVTAIMLGGVPMPAAIGPGEGNWFDLQAAATVR